MDIILILTVLGIIVTAIVPFIGYIYKTRKEYKNYYSLIWKKSSKIKAVEFLGERPCEDYYFERNIDSFLQRTLERKRNALVIGPPLSGKTRAVYNSLKKIPKKLNVLVPRSVNMQSFQLPKDYIFWNEKLIFVDDLQYYVEKQDSYYMLFKTAKEKNIPIIATCHSGREMKKVKNKLIEQNLDLDTIFGEDIIELERISPDEGKKLAEKLGMQWDNVKFNGTIGSIFMRLSEMERRYDSSDNIEKTILRSIRNLYLCGIYDDNSTFRLEWIKKAAGKFELEGKDFEWTGWLKTLEDKEFIKIARRGKIWAEDAYLEYVVKPEVAMTQIDTFEEIIEIFHDTPDLLLMAGERAYDIGTAEMEIGQYMHIAINAFEKALENIKREENEAGYLRAKHYLGQAYWSLSKVQDTLENCRKAIKYFNEILESVSIESNPFEYARIKNRIGNTFTAFAEVENTEQNCKTAIEAYNEALKVFTIASNPVDYARAQNNLGGAYLILSGVRDPGANYKNAIESFNEALKIRTVTEYPKDYALTKNNLANTYAKLSDIEDTERNLKLAADSYEDVLKIYTKQKYPLQFGSIMNNIGITYSMLAEIKDKKRNCENAVEAFEKALEVRSQEQVPVQYANTMYNLGDAYSVLSEADNSTENLYKAIDSFEEALKISTINEYPVQYAMTNYGLARAYIKLAGNEDKSENYQKGIKAYDEALKIYTQESYPKIYENINEEISKAKKIFF